MAKKKEKIEDTFDTAKPAHGADDGKELQNIAEDKDNA